MNSREASTLCHSPNLESTAISDHTLHTEFVIASITVYACTHVYLSIAPILITFTLTTVPTAPTPPRMLTTTGEPSGKGVKLNWLPSFQPNGAIHYEIEYEPAVTPGDPVNAGNSSSPYFTLTLPNEFLTYNVRVAAVNTQGRAQSNVITVCPGQNSQQGVQYIVLVCATVLPYSICCMHEADSCIS